jgi:L-ascorbate metabolism protein UlaG (beta-lactamase superfamily)
MSIDITYLGHAGFRLSDGKHRLVVDPFLTGNDLAKHDPKEIRCDTIALTHGHGDHFGDTLDIAKANEATVIACHEIAVFCEGKGLKAVGGNHGGRVPTDFGWIAFTQAIHSSSWVDGTYMGNPAGLGIRMGDVPFYHAGETDLFSDMKLIGEIYKPDVAAIPMGDHYTMGPELANRAAEWIGARVAIPIHFATFPVLRPDASEFQPSGVEVKVLSPGESWSYGGS